MTKEGMILRCKRCEGILAEQDYQFVCVACSQAYPIREGIILMEEKAPGVNLRIDDNLLDLHKLRKERKYYGSWIQSDVEYAARVHSVNFASFHAELLAPYMANSIVLDLGCGQLPYIEFFPDMKIKEFYGVDLSLESLKIARRNFNGAFPLILVRYGVKNIPFRDTSVDIVVSSEVLEHLDDPKEYLKEIHRVMKDGGYLSLSTPCVSTHLYPHNLPSIIKNPIDSYKKVNCDKFWKEALHWHPGLRPRILKKWMEEAGFSIIRQATRLWYYHTPIRMMWRLFSIVEKIGIPYAGNIFSKYLKMMERLLGSSIPIVNKIGIRQFILCRK